MALTIDVGHQQGEFQLQFSHIFKAGETSVLLGPNGSGKSTLLRLIAGLTAPSSGSIKYDDHIWARAGQNIVRVQDRFIGWVPAENSLFENLTVAENIAFGLRSRGLSRGQAIAAAQNWLERFNLSAMQDQLAVTLSSGESRLIAILRAVASNPKVLLLDEPFANLDTHVQAKMRQLVKQVLNEFGGVSILVTHDPIDALLFADEVVCIENGNITQIGSVDEVSNFPATDYMGALMSVMRFKGILTDDEVSIGEGAYLHVVPQDFNGEVVVTLRPETVALYASAPGGSPRNVWQCRVQGIEPGLHTSKVWLQGAFRLYSVVTNQALQQLSLAEGVEVWAVAKAVDISVQPVVTE